MSTGPQEYGSFGDTYHPEPKHIFLGEVKATCLTNFGKACGTSAVIQPTSLTTPVTVTSNTGDIITANVALPAGAQVTFLVNIAGYTPNDIRVFHRVRASLTAYTGLAGFPVVSVTGAFTTGSFSITIINIGSIATSGPMTITYNVF